jgi:anti-sigma factor RsiW
MEHFAFRDELGPRSGPHLAHLESCADCRREVGIDRELVMHLRRALRARVEGSAPPEASWELLRRRTVDREVRPWTARVLQWKGLVSAAAAGIMVFAVATASETRLAPGTQAPVFVPSSATRALSPVEEATIWPPTRSTTVRVPLDPPLPGWPMETQTVSELARSLDEPPPGRMR